MYRYSTLEKKIGIKFKNKDLLDLAFIHTSYLNEHRERNESNERMEFLGDAVLELAVTQFLYEKFPDASEGNLTAFRSALVKGKHLAEVASELDLGVYLCISHGEEKSGGRKKSFILANTMEALIGAIYLDRGFQIAHLFITKFILTRLDDILQKEQHIDAKTKFQELAQELLRVTPTYELLEASGPDHSKIFVMGAYVKEELIAKGSGSSKQNAEQNAAENALKAKGW